ncbi:MAG: hypothetical protein PHN57_01670 [Candidatus Omnitrophica bacterium]|nr:hypothetical protein [Candidatus Omnitrophota bacterium]
MMLKDRLIIKFIILCAAASGMLMASITPSYGRMSLDDLTRGNLSFAAGPDLLYPVTDKITLSGKDSLEFKWIARNLVQTRYFDFRLYKGYNTIEKNLIFKKQLNTGENTVKLASSMFEVNQVYTWTLMQVFLGGDKSEKSYSPFKIIKK